MHANGFDGEQALPESISEEQADAILKAVMAVLDSRAGQDQ